MSKRIKGINNQAIVGILNQKWNLETQSYKGKAVGQVVMQTAGLNFHSKKENYRPYLYLEGLVESLKGDFPEEIGEITFDPTDQPKMIGVYDFSQEELKMLVDKGLYTSDFEVPALITDRETFFELDMDVNVSVISGEMLDTPLVMATVDNCYDLVLNTDNTGYQLAQYFEKQAEATYKNEYSRVAPETSLENEDELLLDPESVFEAKELGSPTVTTEPVVEEEDELEEVEITPEIRNYDESFNDLLDSLDFADEAFKQENKDELRVVREEAKRLAPVEDIKSLDSLEEEAELPQRVQRVVRDLIEDDEDKRVDDISNSFV